MPKFRKPIPRKKLEARVRAASPSMAEDYDADEPQTKLSSAFIVVLLLHVVAVGGIYAFNSIKSSRKVQEPLAAAATTSTQAATKPSATAPGATTSENINASVPAAAHTANTAAPTVAAATVPAKHYNVKQGDTLTSIAKSAGVTVAELETANSLKPAATLRINQQLVIPAKSATKPAAEMAKLDIAPKKNAEPASGSGPMRTHVVKSGDRLIFIAKQYSVSPDELIAVNKIKDPAKLKVGQSLKIPAKK